MSSRCLIPTSSSFPALFSWPLSPPELCGMRVFGRKCPECTHAAPRQLSPGLNFHFQPEALLWEPLLAIPSLPGERRSHCSASCIKVVSVIQHRLVSTWLYPLTHGAAGSSACGRAGACFLHPGQARTSLSHFTASAGWAAALGHLNSLTRAWSPHQSPLGG